MEVRDPMFTEKEELSDDRQPLVLCLYVSTAAYRRCFSIRISHELFGRAKHAVLQEKKNASFRLVIPGQNKDLR